MLVRLLIVLFIFPQALVSTAVCAQGTGGHPFYIGLTGGYGSTTWEGLVPSKANQGAALNISAPIFVKEGGGLWGAVIGYELTNFFALEANYRHYQKATITFDPDSLFAFDNDDETVFNTRTETTALMAKIMMGFPRTDLKAYSSFGVAGVHRVDTLKKQWKTTPTFGVGFNWSFSEHIMGELGANYTAGYGESELNPSEDYIPFLYSLFINLSYRF